MLETGRVELLYNPDDPLHSDDCAFVIASLQLDFLAEITWPGNVDIGTRVATVGRSSVTIEQGLFQNGLCTATARTVVVQVNERNRRSQPLSDTTAQRFSELMVPAGETRQ
jgi:acyl-CoA thioester hydrolase